MMLAGSTRIGVALLHAFDTGLTGELKKSAIQMMQSG